MKKTLFILFSLLLAVTSAYAIERVITVNGHGEINIDPNVAYLRLGVETVEDSAINSQTKNAETVNKLIEVLAGSGIEKEKIETSNYNLYPIMDYPQGKKPHITGYKCVNQLTVTIDNLDSIGRVIDSVATAGANSIDSIRFDLKDDQKFKQTALEKAVEDAKLKARTIEGAAGVQIKKIHSIIEGGAQVVPFEMARNDLMMAASAPTPVIAGKIKVTADLTVNFEF